MGFQVVFLAVIGANSPSVSGQGVIIVINHYFPRNYKKLPEYNRFFQYEFG